MAAISRSKVKIWIQPSGTAGSALANTQYAGGSSVGYIAGQIKQYTVTGGEDDLKTDPVFGGFVDVEVPRTQYQVELNIIPDIDTNPDIWDAFIYGTSTGGAYVSTVDAGDKAIFIQAQNGSNFKSVAYNNANAISLTWDHQADANRTGKMTFKLSPATSAGIPNVLSQSVAVTSLPAWSALTSS